jgi:tetratricopeptide (TPR) repeat protein
MKAASLLRVSLAFAVLAGDVLLAYPQSQTFAINGAQGEEQLRNIQQLIQTGHLESARKQLTLMLQTAPEDERLYNFLGVIDAKNKDVGKAESDFRKAIQIAPHFAGAYLNLGQLYQESASATPLYRAKALHLYEELLKIEPNNIEANYQAAWLSTNFGAFSNSEHYLTRLPLQTRQRGHVLALHCANLVALGEVAQATSTGQGLLKQTDLTKEDIVPVVAVLSEHHMDEFATMFLEGVAARNLASVEALQELSDIYEKNGRHKDAHERLEQALQLDPSSEGTLFRLAQVAYRSGDREMALSYLAHARDIEPSNSAVRFFFGIICVELNLLPDAKRSFEEAVRIDSTNAFYNYALGAVLIEENNSDESIKYFLKFRELRPHDAHARLALGIAYFYSDHYDEARRELEVVSGSPTTKAGAQLFLGRMAMRNGELGEAIYHFDQSIAADSSVSEAYTDLGFVYIDKKEYQLAEKVLMRALSISPDDFLCNQRLLTVFVRTKDPRAEAQAKRVAQLRETGEEKRRLLLRTLEIHPN